MSTLAYRSIHFLESLQGLGYSSLGASIVPQRLERDVRTERISISCVAMSRYLGNNHSDRGWGKDFCRTSKPRERRRN